MASFATPNSPSRLNPQPVVSIAIEHAYQLAHCGFNEPLFKIFGGFVAEKKVFTL